MHISVPRIDSRKKFDGTVPIGALSDMLRSRIDKPKNKENLLDKLVCQSAPKVYQMSPLESVFYADSLSGRR